MSSSASWDAYDQHYWPARYLIDADGFIRFQHFGEGACAYEVNEEEIQELLSERSDFELNLSGLPCRLDLSNTGSMSGGSAHSALPGSRIPSSTSPR